MSRTSRVLAILVALVGGLPAVARAAAFPDRPVTLIVTYSAGGGADVQLRIFAKYAEKAFGRPFVVKNVVGGTGQTGWEIASRSTPDGYTWVNVNLPQLVLQPAIRDTSYNADSFTPLVMFRDEPSALAVRLDSPFKTVADLVKAAKERKVTLAVTGKWSQHDVAVWLFEEAAGVSFGSVTVDGQAESDRLLLGKHVEAVFGNTSAYYRLGNQLRVLAVAGKKRSPVLPDVPTFEEAGFRGVISGVTMGIGVPKATPPALIQELSTRLLDLFKTNKALNDEMEKAGGSPWFLLDREESTRLIEESRTSILQTLRKRGIQAK